jgi:hypothetical protein
VNPDVDISLLDMLRITGSDASDTGWTDHKVHACDIANRGVEDVDVILENYILNYSPCFPYYEMETQYDSGAAVMKGCIEHYIPAPEQADLQTEGLSNNHANHSVLEYVDPLGMETTMNTYLHPEGHNYSVGAMDNIEDALHRICYWQRLGPGAVPTGGDYSHWMTVRGIRTDDLPTDYYEPYDYSVTGFWVNDPHPLGIGENTYKTAAQFTDNYYKPVVDPDVTEWDGKYITVLEPPEYDADVTIVAAKARFVKDLSPDQMSEQLFIDGLRGMVLVKAVRDEDALKVIQAAIDGVTDELIPYDAEFAEILAQTVPGEPLLVTDEDGDYYLVPFNEAARGKSIAGRAHRRIRIKPIKVKESTLVVVIVDADGSFLEASWVDESVKYLKVSKKEALRLVFKELKVQPFEVLAEEVTSESAQAWPIEPEPAKVSIELVSDASPYHPDWKVTIGSKVFFVDQDGNVTKG